MSAAGFDGKFAQLREAYADRSRGKAADVDALAWSNGHASLEQLRLLAHQICGTAGTFGFDSVSCSAGLLEAAIDENEPKSRVRALAMHLAAELRAMAADPTP